MSQRILKRSGARHASQAVYLIGSCLWSIVRSKGTGDYNLFPALRLIHLPFPQPKDDPPLILSHDFLVSGLPIHDLTILLAWV